MVLWNGMYGNLEINAKEKKTTTILDIDFVRMRNIRVLILDTHHSHAHAVLLALFFAICFY